MNQINIFSGTSGLNTKLDPVRIQFNPETGISDLAEAVNITVDDSGRASRRPGRILLQEGIFHSLYGNGSFGFVVQERVDDAAIMQISTDYSLSGVRSGLTKNLRTSFCLVDDKIFYSNGIENGVIENGVSSAWPTNEHVGPTTSKYFTTAPIGSHIAWFSGRVWVSKDNIVWYSEPYAYGKFDMARGFIMFDSNVRMVKPVNTGIFISDNKKTYFFRGTNPKEMVQKTVSNCPAHEWSEAIDLIDLSYKEIVGDSAIWSSDEGLCIGTEDGEIINISKLKIAYPSGTQGASVVNLTEIINSVF